MTSQPALARTPEAASRPAGGRGPLADAAELDPARIAREHRSALVRHARRHTRSADSAEDAVQRALELLVRHRHRLIAESAVGWLFVVVRHEALALARAAHRSQPVEHAELELRLGGRDGSEEICERLDLLARVHRDLPRLKPHERHALTLQASGLSYREICQLTGWSYTKVNRCLAEGRAALRRLTTEPSTYAPTRKERHMRSQQNRATRPAPEPSALTAFEGADSPTWNGP